ncbi:hypothetical protein [Cutibacterium avidum]|uniref:hypothetical protein n=1 Tax=Cutibacterium avidum TaxID=33010 RepID=UPI0012DB1AC4|nr:hypothetical protein [Cutibacterium avidum]
MEEATAKIAARLGLPTKVDHIDVVDSSRTDVEAFTHDGVIHLNVDAWRCWKARCIFAHEVAHALLSPCHSERWVEETIAEGCALWALYAVSGPLYEASLHLLVASNRARLFPGPLPDALSWYGLGALSVSHRLVAGEIDASYLVEALLSAEDSGLVLAKQRFVAPPEIEVFARYVVDMDRGNIGCHLPHLAMDRLSSMTDKEVFNWWDFSMAL